MLFFTTIVANRNLPKHPKQIGRPQSIPQKVRRTKKYRNSTTRVPAFLNVQSNCLPYLFLFIQSVLKFSLLVFVSGLAKESKHVLFVSFNAGLVERIYCEEIA